LPAPFSPTTAWTSPAWMSRSTRSLATTPGNALVIPRSVSARGVIARRDYTWDAGIMSAAHGRHRRRQSRSPRPPLPGAPGVDRRPDGARGARPAGSDAAARGAADRVGPHVLADARGGEG